MPTYIASLVPTLLKEEFPGHLEYVRLNARLRPDDLPYSTNYLNDGLLVSRFSPDDGRGSEGRGSHAQEG